MRLLDDMFPEETFRCFTHSIFSLYNCPTMQNEVTKAGAERLIKNGIKGLFEGANLPTNAEGQQVLRDNADSCPLYIPGKASNAGGVGVSGLEMAQNAMRLQWKPEEVDGKLKEMMAGIYSQMESSGDTLEKGANRAGFLKVAQAMKELGWVS